MATSSDDEDLVTHAYLVVESVALVRSRLGVAAVVALVDDLLRAIRVEMVDRQLHDDRVLDLAGLLEQLTGRPLKITHGDRRLGDVNESCLVSDPIRQLGWSPRVSLEDGHRQLPKKGSS